MRLVQAMVLGRYALVNIPSLTDCLLGTPAADMALAGRGTSDDIALAERDAFADMALAEVDTFEDMALAQGDMFDDIHNRTAANSVKADTLASLAAAPTLEDQV